MGENSEIQAIFSVIQEGAIRSRQDGVSVRMKRLKSILDWVKNNDLRIKEAIYKDFRKPHEESDISEIYPVISELKEAISNLESWVRPKPVDTPATMVTTDSEIQYEPRGACLIISPWNYPFNLAIGPLISCLAAGNTAIIKPSEMTPNTSNLIESMVEEVFEKSTVRVIQGGVDTSQKLLSLPFDHIFFTGSPQVGKIVMRSAADNLTSVTLELGGKSPAIIDSTADLKDAAEKISWGKFLNVGQTCIAPDYILVQKSVKESFIELLRNEIVNRWSDSGNFQSSDSYGRIVNEKHFLRLRDLIDDVTTNGGGILMGGHSIEKENFIEPTLIDNVTDKMRIAQEEIFGPILPILAFSEVDEAVDYVNSKPKPLALYCFGKSKSNRNKILKGTSAGGVCINDCVIHFGHPNLPFGGVNNSGMGRSHGRFGFREFSNQKAVLKQRIGFAPSKLVYPPYTGFKKKMIGLLKKFF